MSDHPFVAIASDHLSAEIDPRGAQLSRLRDGEGRDLLWDGDPRVWAGKAPILFPIVGMLAQGRYRLGDRTYELPKHGFARTSTFEVAERGPARAVFRLRDSEATRQVYPFAFELDIAFAIEGRKLSMTAVIRNPGAQPLPASFGFHPALRWPLPYGQPRDVHRLTFEQEEPDPIRRIGVDGLVRPEGLPTPVEGRVLALRDDLFIDDAIIFDRLRSRRLTYGAPAGAWLEIVFPETPYLGVWTKPGADYICIEPWQGLNDPKGYASDFREKPGIVLIPPRASRSFEMSIGT